MPTQLRILVAIGLGYIGYRICTEFMDAIGAGAVGVVLALCTFALTNRYPQP